MARLRPGGYLTCFYCGKRSTTRFQRGLSRFDCSKCDATNYLDEDGGITDPPVATETVAPRNAPRSTRAVRGGGGSLPATGRASATTATTSSDSIFCEKCLKNQRLFTASLAQYYSEDPGESESEGPDRDYYKFRRGLEKRYPQVCENCAERVSKAIDKAGYTAKTDHLRKMMDRSRQERSVPKTTTPLDWAAAAGRWLWWGAFVLQILWHMRVVLELLSTRADSASGMSDPDDETAGFAWTQFIVDILPTQEWLVQKSLYATVPACLWNPHVVQVVRGFSKHLIGLTQWYSYQAIIFAIRFCFRYLPDFLQAEGPQSRQALLSAHLAIGCVTGLLYFRASHSIRVDTTPLFASHESTVSPSRVDTTSPPKPGRRMSEGPKSFADLLNDALDAPALSTGPDLDSLDPDVRSFQPERPVRSSKNLGGLNTNATTGRQESAYDEMDWSPTEETKVLPRAFKESASGPRRAFGEAPTQAESGTFWYRAPEAPLPPAHRLRNPPKQASLRMNPNPMERGENIFFRNKGSNRDGQKDGSRQNGGVSFRQPQFFAKDKNSDEANSLADLFGGSFTMSQEEEEGVNDEKVGQNGRGRETSQRGAPKGSPQATAPRPRTIVEAGSLAGSMLVWLLSLSIPIPYTAELHLGILAIAGVVSLRLVLTRENVGVIITVAQVVALGWVAQEIWHAETDAGWQGFCLLGCMLGHLVGDMISGQ